MAQPSRIGFYQDWAPQEAQKLAGHSDIETTMKYYAACRTDIVDRARQAWAIRATTENISRSMVADARIGVVAQ